jgi:hypothetical protein
MMSPTQEFVLLEPHIDMFMYYFDKLKCRRRMNGFRLVK